MWVRFDSDKSGTISMDEFMAEMTRSVPGQGSRIFQNYERTKRNIECLRGFMYQRKITSEKMFQSFKLGSHQSMKMEEFATLIRSINYAISDPEIQGMFSYIDKNSSGTI